MFQFSDWPVPYDDDEADEPEDDMGMPMIASHHHSSVESADWAARYVKPRAASLAVSLWFALLRGDTSLPMWAGNHLIVTVLSARERRESLFMAFLVASLALFLITMGLVVLILRNYEVYFTDDDAADDTKIVVPKKVPRPVVETDSTTEKPPLVGLLLCTLGSRFSPRTFVFPDDGLCAITTFDSLFLWRGNKVVPPYKEDLTYFLKTASGHRRTEYGIGIDYSCSFQWDKDYMFFCGKHASSSGPYFDFPYYDDPCSDRQPILQLCLLLPFHLLLHKLRLCFLRLLVLSGSLLCSLYQFLFCMLRRCIRRSRLRRLCPLPFRALFLRRWRRATRHLSLAIMCMCLPLQWQKCTGRSFLLKGRRVHRPVLSLRRTAGGGCSLDDFLGNGTGTGVGALDLKMISQLMKDKADSGNQRSYTILHYPLLYESMAADVATALLNHRVDLLVAIGYVAYKDYRMKDCRLVPPVLYSTELLDPSALNGTYPIRLVRVISALATLAKQQRALTSTFAVAVGMSGRWYVPEYPDKLVGTPGNYSFGHLCKKSRRGDILLRDQISSIAEGCETPNFNNTFSIDTTFQALFTYDKTDKEFFTYDSASTLRFKLCEAKANVADLHYSIVADGIQYEDFYNVCGYGSYHRLHVLKRLAAFLAENYTSPSQQGACKLLT
ncbi:hypothetical protein HPB52_016408 [Rhipicephalus sanguineus]|uniref:Uncharacterized protein n=1 Tax=Rhipicephalus sanguineus TaxID=34632 RepID=A0A9D4Q9P4_RHISA|nr:hypothetical protein HPB52_016408 [Rhipicephalus sanguineus]